jgi:hypothetical protein
MQDAVAKQLYAWFQCPANSLDYLKRRYNGVCYDSAGQRTRQAKSQFNGEHGRPGRS